MAYSQDIEVGPIRVDTGNDWMDLGFVIILLIFVAAFVILRRKV